MSEKQKKITSYGGIYRNLRTAVTVARLCLKHPRTPLTSKILLAVAAAYAASPIDLIPDFIPLIGHLDDIIIIPLLIFIAFRLIPEDVVEECRKQAEEVGYSMQKNFIAAGVIVFIWISVILAAAAIIYKYKPVY